MDQLSTPGFKPNSYAAVEWTVGEALAHAAASLPDAIFAKKYGIPARTIDFVQDVLSDVTRGRDRHALEALIAARTVLPKAWPENPPEDLFAALDQVIIYGHLDVLSQYPESACVGDFYDTEPAFADALVALIPGFEYPNHSHQTVAEIGRIAQQHCRQAVIGQLKASGVDLADKGRFIGKVVGVAHNIAVQDTGRGVLVAHDLSKAGVEVARGQMLDLRYGQDKSIVIESPERGGIERG